MSDEKKMVHLPDDCDFEDKWAAIEKTVARVLAAPGAGRAELVAAERRVRSLCPQHFGTLYVRMYIHMAEHVVACRHRVEGGARFLTVEPHDGMLDRYAAEWTQYWRGLTALDQLLVQFRLELRSRRHNTNTRGDFEYKESRTVALEDSPWPQDLVDLGLGTWQHFMLWPLEGVLWPRVTAALLAAGEGAPLVGERALRTAVDSALEVGRYEPARRRDAYRRWVLEPYLVAARARHAAAAAAPLRAGDVPRYMRRALAGQRRVRALAALCLPPAPGSRDAVLACYEKAAIAPHVARLQAEAAGLLAAAGQHPGSAIARDALRNLHALLRPRGALRPVRDAARAQLLAEGRRLLADLTDEREMPQRFVRSMAALERKYRDLFADVFKGEQAFMALHDEVCTGLVRSLEGARGEELLARYCDALMRAPAGEGGPAGEGPAGEGPAGEGGLAGEGPVAIAIAVFKRVADTDAFYEHYQRALAARLLARAGAASPREGALIERLKEVAGGDCARKLCKMHEDVSTSATLSGRFKLWHEEVDGTASCEFSVLVLQKWAWPLPEPALPVPAALKSRTDLFDVWYGEQRPRHRLAWHQASSGELALLYAARPLRLTASVPQCAALLAFQTEDRWGSDALRRHLQLGRDEWPRQLRPLLDLKLLLPSGDVFGQGAAGGEGEGQGEGEGESTLTLNLDFADERASIEIACAPPPPKKPEARGEAQRGVGHEEFLHAKIVRLMKQRQTLQHDELVKEVEAETKPWFSPAPELIVKCIESLIRKEYLERVAGKSDTYAYLP